MDKDIEINFYNLRDMGEQFNHKIPFECIDLKTFKGDDETYIQLKGMSNPLYKIYEG